MTETERFSKMHIVKRLFFILIIVAVYFTAWKQVRSAMTTTFVVPQVEAASTSCDSSVDYTTASSTAIKIVKEAETGEMMQYRFNAPAGFYMLFGLVLLTLLKGSKQLFAWLIGYHTLFSLLSISTVYLGLCSISGFLHLSPAANSYFTPFFTFFVLMQAAIPSMKTAFVTQEKIKTD